MIQINLSIVNAILAVIAIVISIINLVLILIYKKKINELIRDLEVKQNKTLFDSISSEKSTITEKRIDEAEAIELAKMMKEAIAIKLKIKSSITYPQLLKELEKHGIPKELKEKLTDFFTNVMKIEYSNKWKLEDIEKIKDDAKLIIKKLKLSPPTKE